MAEVTDEKDSSTTNVSLKWTIHPVSPDPNQVGKVEPITLGPTQYKAIAPPTAPQPSEPPPAYAGRTISSDDENAVKPLYQEVKPLKHLSPAPAESDDIPQDNPPNHGRRFVQAAKGQIRQRVSNPRRPP